MIVLDEKKKKIFFYKILLLYSEQESFIEPIMFWN